MNSDSEALGDNRELVALPYYPENARRVAISKVFLDKEKYIINQAVSEALVPRVGKIKWRQILCHFVQFPLGEPGECQEL